MVELPAISEDSLPDLPSLRVEKLRSGGRPRGREAEAEDEDWEDEVAVAQREGVVSLERKRWGRKVATS